MSKNPDPTTSDQAPAKKVVQMQNGRFTFLPAYAEADAWQNAVFTIELEGRQYQIDHYVKVLPNKEAWQDVIAALNEAGCPTVEGPALWPAEFCGDALGMPQDMWLYLATVNIHGRGLLVLSAPTEEGDQIHRFYQQCGADGVHHVALLCEDVEEDAELFLATGWSKTSTEPAQDGDLIQWFLKNQSGQILELISRPSASHKTFTCNNISSLRASEG